MAIKRKRKKTKERQKADGAAIKFPTNAIACFWLASSPIADLMEWLRDKVMWLRLTTIRYFLSRKEQESNVFVKEEFLHKKIEKKEHFFSDIFDHKLTDTERKVV